MKAISRLRIGLIGAVLFLGATAIAQQPSDFVYVAPGTFTMGSPTGELGRISNETQHQVTLTRAICVSKYEVTQAQWQAVMGWNESYFQGANRPVEKVSWYDAVSYCNQRSTGEGLTPAYAITNATYSGNHITAATVTWNQAANGYRLPTEAEWEYACRAGSTTAFANGPITNTGCTSIDPSLNQMGWYCGNASSTTHDVGSKTENAWGMYDMHGNVWEWCWDWYGSYGGDVTDPSGPGADLYRVDRGGAWLSNAQVCRSAVRGYGYPYNVSNLTGFRPVRSALPLRHYIDREGWTNLPAPILLEDPGAENSAGFFKVCADSSTVSLISFEHDPAMDISMLRLRVKEDQLGSQPEVYGKMEGSAAIIMAPDEVAFRYHHPWNPPPSGTTYSTINIQILDNQDGADVVVAEYPVRIYRAPVVMVHGLWSSPRAFEPMADQLVLSGDYDPYLVSAADYSATAASFFRANRAVVASSISTAIAHAREARIATGKVDLVSHSMGGLLSRIYLQNSWGDTQPYIGDIFRFVSLNSPYDGSQCANLIEDVSLTAHSLLVAALKMGKCDPERGGVTDLRVDRPAIVSLLNGHSMNRNVVPTHVIATLGDFISQGPEDSYSVLYRIAAWGEGMTKESMVNALFGGVANDLVVDAISQEGGVPTQYSHIVGGQTHSGSPSNASCINAVLAVLNASPDDASVWSTSGFSFTQLHYPFTPKSLRVRPFPPKPHGSEGVVAFGAPADGALVVPGETVDVSVSGTADVSQILIVASCRDTIAIAELNGSSGTWSFAVPTNAIGDVLFLALASGPNGPLGSTSASVQVAVAAQLDSLVAGPPRHSLVVGDQCSEALYGFYDDGINRDLTGISGVAIESSNPAVVHAVAPDSIVAVGAGEATLTLTYQGRSTVATVTVASGGVSAVPDPSPIEVGVAPRSLTIWPNPSSGEASVQFELGRRESSVEVSVFDLQGRRIRTFSAGGELVLGTNTVSWNGYTDQGLRAPSGVYYARLRAGAVLIGTAKLVLLR